MKRFLISILCLLLVVGAVCVPTLAAEKEEIAPAYTPSNQLEARCVPLMLEQELWNQGECVRT